MMLKESEIIIFSSEQNTDLPLLPVYSGIKAGFPSPADNYSADYIDLNKELIQNPASTFFGIVDGDSLVDMGVQEGSLVIIDRSLEAQNGSLVVCYIDGEFTMKYVEFREQEIWLLPANEKYKPIRLTEENHVIIWGVVTRCILDMRKKGGKNVRSRRL